MANHDTPTTSRRSLLKAGSVGVFAAAFLAACSDDEPVGISGNASPTTEVAPTAATREPTETELEEVQVQLATLASVEALVADVYGRYASRITGAETAPLVARFGDEHAAAARALTAMTDAKTTAEPNAYLEEHLVAPAESTLLDEEHVQSFLRNLESSLTATYVNAIPLLPEREMRQTLMTHGGATARRVTTLSAGEVPKGAVFPSTDLIANEAYLREAEAEATEDEAAEE